jgi:hypothetical protein
MIPIVAVWTDNYEPLYRRWEMTVPQGFSKFATKIEEGGGVRGFQTDHWYACIRTKISIFISFLNSNPDLEVAGLSDTDIIFFKSDTTLLADYIRDRFNKDPNLEMIFMREHTTDQVNGGFYFVRNCEAVKGLLTEALDSCTPEFSHGDQTFFNQNLKDRIAYEFFPSEMMGWGWEPFKTDSALFHHAVGCKTVQEKLTQQNETALKVKTCLVPK